ncbi:clathrin light chain [Arthroderma uncinatum]|uniref:clathrin light chain n=1 Tax=Arthroderma uncinatum TaxID=74035 RepID=UPI00144AEE3B|nr:clathrin light chain [Arthroderma uncinatum]KAF3483636.1 clathrin light chain [Arthroderma uncinatum]
MADRFPALDDITGDEPVPSPGPGNNAGEDDSDFLARERAALGDDADQFISAGDNNRPSVTVEDDDDLLGGGGDDMMTHDNNSGFESSYPAIESQNENMAPGGTITGVDTPFQSSYSPNNQEPEEESEAVREWRQKRDAELSRRAEASSEKKAATVSKAQQDIDDYYESYNKRTDKARERTRTEAEEFLANREDTAAGGTSWERIAKLVDVSGKGVKGGASGSGKERFREMLLELKKDEKAPGASGV